jgi:hypothetical protein
MGLENEIEKSERVLGAAIFGAGWVAGEPPLPLDGGAAA